jgi:hypothetical protein
MRRCRPGSPRFEPVVARQKRAKIRLNPSMQAQSRIKPDNARRLQSRTGLDIATKPGPKRPKLLEMSTRATEKTANRLAFLSVDPAGYPKGIRSSLLCLPKDALRRADKRVRHAHGLLLSELERVCQVSTPQSFYRVPHTCPERFTLPADWDRSRSCPVTGCHTGAKMLRSAPRAEEMEQG